ncbi:hypothetical protein GCM10027592_07090 [Spirosoma flavus]
MSIQELKSKIHLQIDEQLNEAILVEVSRILSSDISRDILDDLTDEQLAGLEKAREEVRQGKGMSLDDFKRKMETKWPQLKSL